MSLEWNGADVKKKIDNANEAALLACAIQVQGQARLLTPVKTGRLRNSIGYVTKNNKDGDLKTTVGTDEAIIGTNVEYAACVELGTIYQAPKSYLRAGLDNTKSKLSSIYKNTFDRLMK